MTASAPAQPPRLSRRLRWLLIASLTLNLALVGTAAGLALRFAGKADPGPSHARMQSFGPWSGGLEHGDYKAIRRAFNDSGFDFRGEWRADRADRLALVAALRAEPFDDAAVDAVAARLNMRATARMEFGGRMVRDHVLAMTPAARHAFADRLEQSLKRGPVPKADQGH